MLSSFIYIAYIRHVTFIYFISNINTLFLMSLLPWQIISDTPRNFVGICHPGMLKCDGMRSLRWICKFVFAFMERHLCRKTLFCENGKVKNILIRNNSLWII
jgi:hypothetical protein